MGNKGEGVQPEVAEKIFSLQRRCVECGNTFGLQIHHRIFRSEKGMWLDILAPLVAEYQTKVKRLVPLWGLHDVQNLVVVCMDCHEGSKGIHNGNEMLRYKYRESFTHPETGFNIPMK